MSQSYFISSSVSKRGQKLFPGHISFYLHEPKLPTKEIHVYSKLLVTLENSPFSSFVFQKIGFVSLKPWCTQPSSLM